MEPLQTAPTEYRQLKVRNTAEPPPEVITILEKNGLSPRDMIWLAVPTLNPPSSRLSTKEIGSTGLVDATLVLAPLLGNPILDGSLGTTDMLNGCDHQCNTCLADAATPSKMFSLKSLEKSFFDERFLKMLAPDSLLFGYSGDILNHPQGIEIVLLALEATEKLDHAQREQGANHKIVLMTNYRLHNEDKLDTLLMLAERNPQRLNLTVSLPLNRHDTVNENFAKFANSRKKYFSGQHPMNIYVSDIRNPQVLFIQGRVLAHEILKTKGFGHTLETNTDYDPSFHYRGFVKLYLNPDAPWLEIDGTRYESHTHRIFTPITPNNIGVLSKLPYNPNDLTPPNWPGGHGERYGFDKSMYLLRNIRKNKKFRKHLKVIQ